MYVYRGIVGISTGGRNIKCSKGCKKFPSKPCRSHSPTYGVISTFILLGDWVICEFVCVVDWDFEGDNDCEGDEEVLSFMMVCGDDNNNESL